MIQARHSITHLLAVLVLLLQAFQPAIAQPVLADQTPCAESEHRRYTFSWNIQGQCSPAPRGGTSRGAPLTLDPTPHEGWLSLQAPGLDDFEKDRRAILAMAGPYRTSFEFLETVGYTTDFKPDRPYQSWGTEYIYVVEDSSDFISLQHIMVMFVAMPDGRIEGPIVQKHWRQDWQYEKTNLLEFQGYEIWQNRALSREQVKGTWAQSVFQVDDSPRYESLGRWQHYPNFSTWISAETWRPLPRRESTVRDDYQVLEGTNRHTIVANGWVHEEENYKLALQAPGERTDATPYLSKELGVNRYERIIDFDFSAGDQYWENTGPFWADVRKSWQALFDANPRLEIKETINGRPLFAMLFGLAEEQAASGPYDSDIMGPSIEAILLEYTSPAP
jgi:hypothetical protein